MKSAPTEAARALAPVGANGPTTENAAMAEVLETARRVARSRIPVLLSGETGTGKEVLARLIHESGPRHDRPMLCVNCGAIAAQLLESALFGHEKGAFTGAIDRRIKAVIESAEQAARCFLDEIGELPPAAQVALLRVLENKKVTRVGATREIDVDVRVVAATHRDWRPWSRRAPSAPTSLYRLNALTLRIPPLRQRVEDIAALARRFLTEAAEADASAVQRISPAAMERLEAYAWPGNVREPQERGRARGGHRRDDRGGGARSARACPRRRRGRGEVAAAAPAPGSGSVPPPPLSPDDSEDRRGAGRRLQAPRRALRGDAHRRGAAQHRWQSDRGRAGAPAAAAHAAAQDQGVCIKRLGWG